MNIIGLFLPFLIILVSLQQQPLAMSTFQKRELDPPYDIYSEVETSYFEEGLQLDNRKNFLDQLVIAKSLLIDGHANDAILVLEKLNRKTKSYNKRLLINHFLALAYFSEANTTKARQTLSQMSENATSYYHNCAIRMITALSLPDSRIEEMKTIFRNCVNNNINNAPHLGNTWAEIVLKHKEKGYLKNSYVRNLLASNRLDNINMILKYGLYYNKSNQVLKYYDTIPVDLFANPELRTLVAVNLYNSGQEEKALKLIQTLNNSNANKIKGLQEVKKENYKTAFSHFISNTISKPYSINNNQLILASAWLSSNYKSAREALAKIPVSEALSREKDLLKVNILIKEGKTREANYIMKNLDIRYNRKLPYEAAILSTYLKLLRGDRKWIELSDQSCLNKNVISCWLHMQSKIWPDYTKDIINKDQQMEAKTIQNRLDKMVEKKPEKDLKGPTLLYQKDIYELDLVEYPELRESSKNSSDSQL